MVAWYAGRMQENGGTNRLKNEVETRLCADYSRGNDVLDVGIGTGRASLPLIDKGYRLTGIDSSAAMLDECRRQAGDRPIALRQGDVAALPLADASFDTLLSLNVMTHFPHWREVLKEWRRVVRPGGRILFDMYSLDHLRFAEGRPVTVEELAAQGPGSFNMHVAVDEVLAHADEVGLRVAGIIPYGVIFSSRHRRFNEAVPLDRQHWWQRQLAWIAADEALFRLCLFLELELFLSLPHKFSGRFMIVLDNLADPAANRAQGERLGRLATLCAGPVQWPALAEVAGTTRERLRAGFAAHMAPLRNRVFAYLLLTAAFGRPEMAAHAELLPEPWAGEWTDWLAREQGDWRLAERRRRLRESEPLRRAQPALGGLSIGGRADYELTHAWVSEGLLPPAGAQA